MHIYIYIYIYAPITPFGGAFWVSRCQEIEGDMKNQGEKKTNKQKKTKCQDIESTHLCLFGAFITVKLGIF